MACPTGKLCVNPPDPRINYNLGPGEVLKTCPYNFSHAILPIKFLSHVWKCHRRHCKDQKAKGEKPLFSICRYDHSHHVRNEELAFHQAQCKIDMEKGDDWSDGTQGTPGPPKVDVDVKVAPLRPPPPIDEASLKTITGESWESEETGVQFDHRKKIKQCRLDGYNVVNTLDAIGLTKSEKKEFYRQDSKEMSTCAKISFLNRLKKENSGSGGGSAPSSSNSVEDSPPSSQDSYEEEIIDLISDEEETRLINIQVPFNTSSPPPPELDLEVPPNGLVNGKASESKSSFVEISSALNIPNLRPNYGECYGCVVCKETFRNLLELRRHLEEEHELDPRKRNEVKCGLCGEEFASSKVFHVHRSQFHTPVVAINEEKNAEAPTLVNQALNQNDNSLGSIMEDEDGEF